MNATPSVITKLFLVIITLSANPETLSAATRVKENNSDNLNQPSSWTNGIVPGNADVAQFDSTVTTSLTLALGAATTWNQLNLVNPGGDVTFGAGNTLTLSNNTPVA